MDDKLIKAASVFLADNGFSGWTQSTNAKFFLQVLLKLHAQKASQEQMLFVMNKASNASAFRQVLIRAKVIAEAVEGSRTSKSEDILGGFDL